MDLDTHPLRTTVWATRVGPYANPQEIYSYFSLPFCRTTTAMGEKQDIATKLGAEQYEYPLKDAGSLSELMGGYDWQQFADFTRNYPDGQSQTFECTTDVLSEKQAEQFSRAVKERYFYQLFVEDLPIWGMVGEMVPTLQSERDEHNLGSHTTLSASLFTSRSLSIYLSPTGRVARADLTSDLSSFAQVRPGKSYDFKLTVDVMGYDGTYEYEHRFDRYKDQLMRALSAFDAKQPYAQAIYYAQ